MRNGRNASITEITETQVITDWLLRKTGAVAWKAGDARATSGARLWLPRTRERVVSMATSTVPARPACCRHRRRAVPVSNPTAP